MKTSSLSSALPKLSVLLLLGACASPVVQAGVDPAPAAVAPAVPAVRPAAAAPNGYLSPPAPIDAMLRASPTPVVSVGPNRSRIALLDREDMPGIAELAAPELRLAGVRINPRTNGPSRDRFSTGITFKNLDGGAETTVQLPAGARISDVRWSPDGERIAFSNTADNGIELWVAEVATGAARRLLGARLNAAAGGSAFDWLPDSQGLLVRMVPAGRAAMETPPAVPNSPVIQENTGKTAPARTYQDLLENTYDERLFEHFFTSQLAFVPVDGGAASEVGQPGIISDASVSPNGEYLLVETVQRPFSYIVPMNRFPQQIAIWDRSGRMVKQIADLPLADQVPIAFDAVTTGPRSVQWRADAPATLAWAEALDGGDPRRESAQRDRVFVLDAPFSAQPAPLITLEHRYAGVQWGRDDFALVSSRWWNTRTARQYAVQPANPSAAPRLLKDRSYDDRYGDPGDPVSTLNDAGRAVLLFSPDGSSIYLTAQGASPRGNYPFLDRMNIRTSATERLWQNEDPYYENVVAVLEPDASRLLTRRESLTEPPNYLVRSLPGAGAVAVTNFPDPAPQLAGVQRELITYPRGDGVTLSATLYTPPGYDIARDGPLPMLMWAYPREFRDAAAASQVSDSPNRFSRPGGISHLFLLTQGYAILDGPAMPIIGEGGAEPNDTYVEQLVSSAAAAIDKVVEMGVASRDRIGIGGHSYGAFMTANLLAHSDLFRAGIARSGAYNRTLTPFGFQAEQRTYWQAPQIYNRMSPFMNADKVDEPLLMTHGLADNNSGTFPVQSERFYAAVKGHGGTVRLVMLPHESHGYAAHESVGHVLAEMTMWMDTYVKNAPARAESTAAARSPR